jgi:hypothetical protein
MYIKFLEVVKSQVAICIPSKDVAIGPKDPEFVTPLVKSLLVKRNRMRRRGRTEEADSLAARINNIIANVRSCRFAKLTNATSKELWEAVKGKARINNETDRYAHILSSPDIVNVFFFCNNCKC